MSIISSGMENDLLRFEPLSDAHREVIFASDLETAIWKWMPALPKGANLASYYKHMLAAQEQEERVTYVLFRKSDNAFCGLTGFSEIDRTHRKVRNALAWHPPDKDPLKKYLFGQISMIERAYDWGAKRLEWRVNTKNDFILSGMERIGAKKEATLRNFERTAQGTWADKAVFALTRPEMQPTIERLNALIHQEHNLTA